MRQPRTILAASAAMLILAAGLLGWYFNRPGPALPAPADVSPATAQTARTAPPLRVITEAPLQFTQPTLAPGGSDDDIVSASADGTRWLIISGDTLTVQDAATNAPRGLLSVGVVGAATLLPDGKQILMARSGEVMLVGVDNPSTASMGASEPALSAAPATALAVDALGNTVAVACGSRIIILDIPQRRVTATLSGHADVITCLAFADATHLVSGSRDRTLRLWDTAAGKTLRTFEAHTQPVLTLAVSPDGKYALSGGLDARAILWNLDDGKILWHVRMNQEETGGWAGRVVGSAFLDNGRRMLTSTMTTATLWDFDTHQPLAEWKFGRIGKIAIGPEGGTFRSGRFVWTIPTADPIADAVGPSEAPLPGRLLSTLGPPALPEVAGANPDQLRIVRALRLLSGGQALAGYGGWNKPVIVRWDLQTGAILARVEPPLSVIGQGGIADFSPDGALAAIISGNQVHLIDTATGKDLRACTMPEPSAPIEVASFTPDGKYLLVPQTPWANPGRGSPIHLFNINDGKLLRTFEGAKGLVRALAVCMDGTHVVATEGVLNNSAPSALHVWDFATGKELHNFPGDNALHAALALSADGTRALVGSNAQPILRDLNTGGELLRLPMHLNRNGHLEVPAVALSPNGKWAATGGADDDIRLYDAATGAPVTRFEWHQGAITALRFLGDNQRLLSASADGTLRLWELPKAP